MSDHSEKLSFKEQVSELLLMMMPITQDMLK